MLTVIVDLIMLALLLAIARLVVDLVAVYVYDLGRHFWDMRPENYNGFLTVSFRLH